MNSIYEEVMIALHLVWRRRWLALAVAATVCLAGWLVVALIPNTYESQARIFVQMQSVLPDKIGITSTEQIRDIDRVQQTLASTVNLEKVVRGTDLSLQATSDKDVAAIVERLRNNISIKSPQDNLYQISAKSSAGGLSDQQNAKLAKAVVQKLIDIFVEENLAGNRDETSQGLRFLDEQLAQREKQLQEAEQKKADFEQKYAGMLPGVGSVSQRMDASRSELADVDSNLAAAQSSLAALNGQLAGLAPTVATPGANGAVGGYAGRLAALEGQLSDAQARGWTDEHPDVIALKQQIARLRPLAAREPAGGGGGGTPNPMYVTLRSMQAEKQATVAALMARKSQLQSDMNQFIAKQAQQPGIAAEQQQLDRDYDVLKAQYDKLLADREDVKLRSDVQSQTDAVKFRVIDPPSAPRLPVAPNRPLMLTAILIIGLGAGFAVAFGKAQLAVTYATATRLEKATGLPVIGSVSEILTPMRREERRRKLVWFASGAGALVGVYALLMVVEFVQRGMVA
ncbi:XrtA system polysaccharide chain length determinant [Flavisphingomonas formosensis]|uniref:XrtA system polysaccharide chain length determinant n=1 Tax=Flavisphingomonas formosensis TaxID=861534 RepID=UPI0012F7C620|nr:XrtA system polysaccharide chain length determinant [Sphingomonas formosensis]